MRQNCSPIRTIRQDYVHNQGKATSKQAKNKRLKWFARGEQMIPTSANYEQLFHELVDELAFPAGAPTPIEKPNRGPVKARVPIDFVSQFRLPLQPVGDPMRRSRKR